LVPIEWFSAWGLVDIVEARLATISASTIVSPA
jgi:hypothetical protein